MIRNFTVLIVDDDEDDRIIFCDTVHELYPTANCITAPNGLEALNRLKVDATRKPNVIFLDINMPKMNGKKCLTELKKLKTICNIPVVMYSTSKLLKDVEETKALGAIKFLTKPTKMNDLKAKIKETLEGIIHPTVKQEKLNQSAYQTLGNSKNHIIVQ